jgi:general secretion pathway protein K
MARSERGLKRQRGAALIIALLVVAMVVMLATALSSDFLLMFRRVENQLYSEQSYAYLRGAEALSRAALLLDLQKDGQTRSDNLAEDWAQPQQYPTDYGWIGGQLEDLQGRFNLNSLGTSQAGGGPQTGQAGAYSAQQYQFIRLLLALPFEEPLTLDQAQALTDAVSDWIDSNDDVSNLGGAESQYYEKAEPMGRPANRTLVGPSELMFVKGMTPAIYRALAPLVTVWPARAGSGAVNVNTAPIEVLRSLGGPQDPQPLTEGEVETLLDARKPPKYIADNTAVAALLSAGVLANKHIVPATVTVFSDYFLLNTTTEFQGHRYSMRSVLHRRSDVKPWRVDVETRSFGDW